MQRLKRLKMLLQDSAAYLRDCESEGKRTEMGAQAKQVGGLSFMVMKMCSVNLMKSGIVSICKLPGSLNHAQNQLILI